MLSPYRFVPRLTGTTVARGLCVVTAVVLLVAIVNGRSAGAVGQAFVAAQVLAALVVYARATQLSHGTVRVLFAGLTASAMFAAIGHATWAILGALGRPLS